MLEMNKVWSTAFELLAISLTYRIDELRFFFCISGNPILFFFLFFCFFVFVFVESVDMSGHVAIGYVSGL